ncbi:hypothetical protein KC356_g170 [Hortaea werneckii]|nr:hypothetical protein KC356_g170 [Hortaea werneckii]
MRTLSPSAMSAAFLASTKPFTFQSTDFDLLLVLEGDLQLLKLVVSVFMLQRRKTCFLHSPGISETRIRLFQPLTCSLRIRHRCARLAVCIEGGTGAPPSAPIVAANLLIGSIFTSTHRLCA